MSFPTAARPSRLLAVFVVLAGLAPAALSHEVRPAIADVSVTAESVRIEIRLSLEALVARIDLDGLKDTDESPLAADYDALRALDAAGLETALRSAWPDLRQTIRINVADRRIIPELDGVAIPAAGTMSLPRDSKIMLQAILPAGNDPVTLGWDKSNGPLIVRQSGGGEDAYTGYLTGGQTSAPMPRVGVATEPATTVFWRYVVIGFEHIVPKGLDHILFVLGLFFFSTKFRPLLLQVTAFTLAHTVTLALASLDIVNLSSGIVEPLIAASIVYVAVENVFDIKLRAWRTAVVFAFGLLHGLGFAAVLSDVGLDSTRFVLGLIAFNIGVEFGQLAVILAAFLLVGLPFRNRPWYRTRIAVPCSIAIALVGTFWFFERVLG